MICLECYAEKAGQKLHHRNQDSIHKTMVLVTRIVRTWIKLESHCINFHIDDSQNIEDLHTFESFAQSLKNWRDYDWFIVLISVYIFS